MLWDGGYPLLELHLDRLMDSAEYFGFECERDSGEGSADRACTRLQDRAPRKVRLLVDSEGRMNIGDEALAKTAAKMRSTVRACISPQQDRSERSDALPQDDASAAVCARPSKRPCDAGFDDVLFMNERGEVTEGAISNVFIEKDGQVADAARGVRAAGGRVPAASAGDAGRR